MHVVLISVQKLGEIAPYLRVADFLRTYFASYIFLPALSNSTHNSTVGSPTIEIFKLLGEDDITTDPGTSAFTGSGSVTITDADERFYLIEWTGIPPSTYTVSYQTALYKCPFPNHFADIKKVFQGCYHSDSPTIGNLHAAYAIQTHSCGKRQFFNGACTDVDAKCDRFNPLGT